MNRVIDNADVICEMKPGGEIIPMRFRIVNDDGLYEDYTVRGYRRGKRGAYTSPDGLAVCNKDIVYECRVLVDDIYKTVRLYFDTDSLKWRVGI